VASQTDTRFCRRGLPVHKAGAVAIPRVTMFMPPVDWQTESGPWRTYYYYNRGVTTEVLGTKALEIIDELAGSRRTTACSPPPWTRSIRSTTS